MKFKKGDLVREIEQERLIKRIFKCCEDIGKRYNSIEVATGHYTTIKEGLPILSIGEEDIYEIEIKYCPFCGKKIKIVSGYTDEEWRKK